MLVIMASQQAQHDHEWGVAEAKARLSEVIDRVLTQGPQTITRKGKKTVVVVSADEWERRTRRRGSLADFLAASPLRGSVLEIERPKDGPREITL
jgi:prevent-host-death family protein